MLNTLGLNIPLKEEQYRDINLPHTLAKNVADAVNKTLGTQYTGHVGFQGDSVNISLS